MSVATVRGKITDKATGLPISDVKVYGDTRNLGSCGPADPFAFTNSDGDFLLEANVAITNMQPIRQVLPVEYTQNFPANGQGFHIALGLGQEADNVNFIDVFVPVTPTEPVTPPVVVVPPVTPPVTPIEPVTPPVAPITPPTIVVTDPVPPVTTVIAPGFSPGGNISSGAPLAAQLKLMQQLRMKRGRIFSGDPFSSPIRPATITLLQTIRAAGLSTTQVMDFEWSNKKSPITTIGKYVGSIPTELVKDQYGEYGNELDSSNYNNDTAANVVAGLKNFSDAWRSKGGKVVLGNISAPDKTTPWNFYMQIFSLGADQYIDYWGGHCYEPNATLELEYDDKVIAYCEVNKIGAYFTEKGYHNATVDQIAAQSPILWGGLASRGVLADYFPIGWTNTQAGLCALLNQDGTPHDPVYDAMVKVAAGWPV